MKTGNLVDAASRLAFCASPVCPVLMRQDCAERLRQVTTATPSLLLTIEFDAPRVPVRVSIDGQGRAWGEDARQLIVNPGRHELRVEAEGFKTQTLPLLVGEGEQSVPVELRLASEKKPVAAAAPSAAPVPVKPGSATSAPVMPATKAATAAPPVEDPPARVGPPTAAIWVAASSLIGFTGFVYFGLKARQREGQLEAQCAPMCTSSEVAEVKQDYLLANGSLGLGVASLVASGVLFLVHSGTTATSASRIEPRVQMSPTSLGLAGRF